MDGSLLNISFDQL